MFALQIVSAQFKGLTEKLSNELTITYTCTNNCLMPVAHMHNKNNNVASFTLITCTQVTASAVICM